MKSIDVIRAWKDRSYFNQLTVSERESIANPAGMTELHDDELLQVAGGASHTCSNNSCAKICHEF